MAQKSATLLVIGKCVKQRRVSGDFISAEDGRKVDYDFIEVRVLTPSVDVVEVRFPPDGKIPVPAADRLVLIRCDVRGSGANVKVTAEQVEDAVEGLAALVDESAA